MNSESINGYCILIEVENKNPGELEHIIPKSILSNSDIQAVLGYKALNQKLYIQSIQYFEKAIENDKEDNPDYKAALASVKLEMITNQYLNFPHLNKNEISKESIDLLDKAINKLNNTELIKYKHQWYLNRGVAKKIIGDIDGAKDDMLQSLAYNPKDVVTKRDLALLEFEYKDQETGIQLLEEIEDNSLIPETKILLADMYRIIKKYEKAEKTIVDFIKSNKDNIQIDNAKRVLEHIYIAKSEFEKAEIINKERIKSDSKNLLALIDATSFYSKEDEEIIKAKLKEAILYINPNTTTYEKRELANKCYDLNLNDEAISLFEMFINMEEDSQESRRLLNCYFKRGKFEKALKLCKALRNSCRDDISLIDLQTYILEQTGNMEDAKLIYEEAINNGVNPLLIINYANLCLRNNDFSKVDELLGKDINIDLLKMEDRIRLGYLYSNRNFKEKFYELMYETRRKFFNESDAHNSYAGLFLQRGDKDLDLLNLKKVTTDSVVFLKRNNEQKFYILDNRDDADLSKDEVNDKSVIYNKLIGKKKNEKIDLLENDYIKESWRIIEIKSKYIHALHKSMDMINVNFPEEKSFQKITFDNQENSAESIQKLLDLMFRDEDKRRENLELLLKGYREGKATIGIISKYLNKNPIEIWSNFVSDPIIGINNNSGSMSDLDFTYKKFDPVNGLVIDIIALCTLVNLNICDLLVKVFGKFTIAQSTVDVIISLKNQIQGIRSKGYSSIGKAEGKYFMVEVTPDTISNSIDFLDQLLNTVDSYCDIVTINPKTIEDIGEYGKYKDLIGKSFIDTILLSKQEHKDIYSDDNALRSFSYGELKIRGVWTQFLLQFLLQNNEMEISEYNNAIIKLSDMNYFHTSIDANIITEKGKQIKWIPDSSFKNILKILNGRYSDEFPSIIVSVNFIFELWNQIISNEKRNFIFDLLLNNLVKDRSTKNVLFKLKLALEVKFRLLPLQLNEILTLISTWEGRTII